MRASLMNDPLYDAGTDDDFDLDVPEPMRPIRLQYVTYTDDRALLVNTCERLGLVHVWVGQHLYALNECDTTRIRLDARAALHREGQAEASELDVARRVEAEMKALVAGGRRDVAPLLVSAVSRAQGNTITDASVEAAA